MSNLNASHKVMQHYLLELLTEETAEVDVLAKQQQQQLNSLLSQVSEKATTTEPVATKLAMVTKPQVKMPVIATSKLKTTIADKDVIDTKVTQQQIILAKPALSVEKDYRKGRFQALFFQLAGLKVAVPLKELGGIYKLGHVNSLIGKPEWFKGVMLYREQKINIVDTARWVMPEKYDEKMQQQLNYQYVIMLANSNWGICCESLVNTFMLEQDDVQWRQVEGKRPWLAGVIKEHMCVLVDVDAMIDLFNRGLDITA